jgi:carbamoyltransferase
LVRNAVNRTGLKKIAAAGGVFANVLMNQKILEMPEVEDIYIYPAMSDGGIALGAAIKTLSDIKKRTSKPLMPRRFVTPYLGPSYSNAEIENEMKKMGVKYTKMDNAPKKVAELIHTGKIVAVYQGRMEYGPRALGNRSIMYAPTDPTVNKWLNDKLNRSEFMPFAPVTLAEKKKECYLNIVEDPIAATYMTITYNCTNKMKSQAPACIHVDGTARPQIIKREQNPYYYDILNEYYKISGNPSLINTSYNMHEEPIVCSPHDSLRAFFDSKIDYLVMEKYLVALDENGHIK